MSLFLLVSLIINSIRQFDSRQPLIKSRSEHKQIKADHGRAKEMLRTIHYASVYVYAIAAPCKTSDASYPLKPPRKQKAPQPWPGPSSQALIYIKAPTSLPPSFSPSLPLVNRGLSTCQVGRNSGGYRTPSHFAPGHQGGMFGKHIPFAEKQIASHREPNVSRQLRRFWNH